MSHHEHHHHDPLLVSLDVEMSNIGVYRRDNLYFYTPVIAYKVWIEKSKYFTLKLSKVVPPFGPERIQVVSGRGVEDVLKVLHNEMVFLTPEEAMVQWAGQEKYEKDHVQYEQPFLS